MATPSGQRLRRRLSGPGWGPDVVGAHAPGDGSNTPESIRQIISPIPLVNATSKTSRPRVRYGRTHHRVRRRRSERRFGRNGYLFRLELRCYPARYPGAKFASRIKAAATRVWSRFDKPG
jgi:hypothetical protein